MALTSIAVSGDGKWIVGGTFGGASVWDMEILEKIVEVEGANSVVAVDVSPDSTRFATGTSEASIWSVTTGERLIGPLEHDCDVTGIRFSPDGERIATACYRGSGIRVFDSRNGDELTSIKVAIPSRSPITPLAWANDGKQNFATSADNKVKSFDVSTGSQIAESQILDGNSVRSIALAGNEKFIATSASRSITLLDPSTLTQIGPIIEDSEDIRSIALSPDCNHLATGRRDGNIVIRDLSKILPVVYGPFHASTRSEQQHLEQPSTSGNKPTDPKLPEEPRKPGLLDSPTHSDNDSDLLELAVPSSTPLPLFDYDEPPSSSSSVHPSEDEALPVGSSIAVSQSAGAQSMTSIPSVHPEENPDTIESFEDISVLKRWSRVFLRASSRSPATVDAASEGHSSMNTGKRQQRTVGKSVQKQRKSPVKATVPSDPNKDTASSGQSPSDRKEAGHPQHTNDLSQPPAGRVHVTRQPGSSDATILIRLPAWMLCFHSGTEDGMH
ncbi:WD40 repeat-like protein [Imleria badia]|nr:WD40 repeat-like protein [Imleria badia]